MERKEGEKEERDVELEYLFLISTNLNWAEYYNHAKILLDHVIVPFRKDVPSTDIAYNGVTRNFGFKGDGQHKICTFLPNLHAISMLGDKTCLYTWASFSMKRHLQR